MPNIKDILPQDNQLKNEQILSYVEKTLTDGERHELESALLQDNFENDAVEGLEQFSNKASIEAYVNQLNEQLQKQTTKKKIRKNKRKLEEQDWIIIAIGIILTLCVVGYYIVKKLEQ